MKSIFYINFLFIFIHITYVFIPIIPLVEYAVNYKYISEELCENKAKPEMTCSGKCYLTKRVKVSYEKNNADENQNAETSIAYDFKLAILHKIIQKKIFLFPKNKAFWIKEFLYNSRHLEVEDKPPAFYS